MSEEERADELGRENSWVRNREEVSEEENTGEEGRENR